MVKHASSGGMVVALLALVACNTPPPQPWLRFQPDGHNDWTTAPDGRLATRLHGAEAVVDQPPTETRVQVTVTNTSAEAVEMRMGPEGGRVPRAAIGQVLLRPVDGPPGAGGPDMLPYNTMQAVTVEPGWRGTFYLDSPLGRDPVLGQYFVLAVEANNKAGAVERRRLPLIATNAGTTPSSQR